jgi:zinc transporter 1/2/3
MAISVEKWLVMAALGVISFILGMIPYLLMKRVQQMRQNLLQHVMYHLILTILSCAGAGVLLATTAMHMLPEVRESLAGIPEKWTTGDIDDHFPMAEVLMLSGFALIYLIEEIAHFIMVDSEHSHSHHHGITRHSSMAHAIPVAIPGGPRASLLSTTGSIQFFPTQSGVSITLSPDPAHPYKEQKIHIESNQGSGGSLIGSDFTHDGLGSKLRSFLALIALSFHAIIEGIAIGIQDTSSVWFMFGAIASHKFVISFCMGMELCASRAKFATVLTSIIIFAVLSPLGIFIGSYLTSDATEKSLAVVIVEGFATGTLMYVVFFEILNRERERKSGVLKTYRSSGFVQFISLTIGIIAMGYLLSVNEHSHGDDHSHDDHEHEDCTTPHDHDHTHDHDHFKLVTVAVSALHNVFA